MIYAALGETEVIGASCHYLQIEGTGIVLDAGADPEEEGPDSLPRFDFIHDHPEWFVDHAIITHAHHDHIGSLPIFLREFPHAQIHMTRATRELAEMVLPASARLQRRKQLEGSTHHDPLFTEEELEVQSYIYAAHDLDYDFDVTGVRAQVPLMARFYDAGHVLGAAGVLLAYEKDGVSRRLFYTSDTNLRSQSIIPGGTYPEAPVDVLLLESTLGADPNAEQTTRRTEEKKFAEALQRVIGRGGVVLLPVFALGRAQEILALLGRFKKRGLLPDDLPVFTAGSMRAFADLYDRTRYNTPRLNPDFEVFGVQQRRVPRRMSTVRTIMEDPCILVASSGMMFERTLSNRLAQELVEDEKHGIFLVGYARPDSPSGELLDAAQEGKGTEVVLSASRGAQPVNCEVERFRFSGHSHRRDLIQLVERLRPQTVVLIHGDQEARTWMADNIRFFHPEVTIRQPALGEVLEL